MSPEGALLAVDLGSSHTVAVLVAADGARRLLLFDDSPLLPSAVFAAPDVLLAGRDAVRAARSFPDRFEPYPKLRLGEGRVLLGGREVEDVDLLAGVYRRVALECGRVAGVVPPTVLTCPAAWGAARRERLVHAARQAGLPVQAVVEEPVAAAGYFTAVLRQRLAAGRPLAVFDFGGGTLDLAIVRGGPAGPAVVAYAGLPDLGGRDIDAALVNHLHTNHDLPRSPQTAVALWDEVRAAKETLSRTSTAPIHLGDGRPDLHLTRAELEQVARPLLDRAVAATARLLRDHNIPPGELAGLFLVGGASRMPLVAALLHRGLGISPTTLEQPETAVAEGAAILHRVPPAPPASAAEPSPAPLASPVALRPRRRRRAAVAVTLAAVTAAAAAGFIAWRPDLPGVATGGKPSPSTSATSPSTSATSPAAGATPLTGLDWPHTRVRLLDQDPDPCLTGTVDFSDGQARAGTVRWRQVAAHRPQDAVGDLDGDGRDEVALVVQCAIVPGSYGDDVWVLTQAGDGTVRLLGMVDMEEQTVERIALTDGKLTITPGDPARPGTPLPSRDYEYTGIPALNLIA